MRTRPLMYTQLADIYRDLSLEVSGIDFSPPVFHVYNPLDYAWSGFERYLRYCEPNVDFFLVGMNPGPWGMVQTGIPFGDARMVSEWLRIDAHPAKPVNEHPKRPIHGMDCPRAEISGQRLWGWAEKDFGTPEAFFRSFFVGNYCPLAFLEENGKNRTPDKLKKEERKRLFTLCDRALEKALAVIRPQMALGIGKFAESRLREVGKNTDTPTGGLPHPSPANPRANKGWADLARKALREYASSQKIKRLNL